MASVSVESRGHRKPTRKANQSADCTPTPDGRYFVVRARLWRLSNPALDPEIHQRLVRELMAARRAVRTATPSEQRIAARLKIDAAKKALGERGEVWWDDGAPDYNRCLAVNTPYAAWFRSLTSLA
ncbi:MAG: hypothetical protein M3O26_20995 [Pseudomonadota bacterium]|nr:hypothetical protein [Pseudomonadota bacterium]